MTDIAPESDVHAAVAALAAADRVLIATHENPDGDAIGSMTAAAAGLRQLGKEVRMYLEPASTIPHEVSFLDTRRPGARHRSGRRRGVDAARASTAATSAGSASSTRRCGRAPGRVVDVDHHHDNSRFGDVNLVDGHASSTAEILVRIFDGLGVEITPKIAEALYVGLVTDTGRFQYRTTSPEALRLAARLVEAGTDVHKVFERVFESVQLGKLLLLGRVIEHTVPYYGGRLLVSHVSREDLALVEGDEATTEGLIDHLRAVEGVQVAGLIREQVPLPDGTITPNRVSLRSRGLIDVSQIARKSAGGGHKQAAGFSHPGTRRRHPRVHRRRGRRPAGRAGRLEIDRARWRSSPASCSSTSPPGRARSASCGRCGRRSGRSSAMPGTLDPFATGLLLVLAGRATRLATYLSGLDKRYEAVVQFGAVSTTLDPEGDLEPTGAATDADAVAAAAAGHDRRRAPGGPGRLGRQDRRPALLRPHAGRRGGRRRRPGR